MIAESNHYKVNIKAKVITVRSDVRSWQYERVIEKRYNNPRSRVGTYTERLEYSRGEDTWF